MILALIDGAGEDKARQYTQGGQRKGPSMGDEQILPTLTGLNMENEEPGPMLEPPHNQRPIPRFEPINREQMVMREVDVEQLVDQEYPVTSIWEFVERLGLCSL